MIDIIFIDVFFNGGFDTGPTIVLLNDFSRFSDTRVAYYRLVINTVYQPYLIIGRAVELVRV